MSFRVMCQVVFGALVAATACGGNVKGEAGTPTEQLRADSAGLCKSACATILKCGGDQDSCSCGCACSAGSDCTCPPCDCGTDPQTPAQCESGCTGSVEEVIDDDLGCDQSMLTLLHCLASEPCKDSGPPCKAESDAMKNCEKAKHSSAPPTSGSPSAGTPGGPDVITCRSASGGGSASDVAPGDVLCQTGWESCSDGNSYSVECRVTAGTALECDCSVNGNREQTISTTSCPESTPDADTLCGWHLG